MRIDFQDILSVSEVPYGTLPVLDVDGKILAQSTAIARFVAAECGGYFTFQDMPDISPMLVNKDQGPVMICNGTAHTKWEHLG